MTYIGIDIYEGAPDDVFVEVSKLPDRRWYRPGSLPEFEPESVDVYFSPAPRKERGSEKGDVYGTRVLWADIDDPTTPLATLKPSAIVWSGGGYHYYWLLSEWCTDGEKIEAANRILMEDVGGDSCWNVNRVLRVPGTINSKYTYDDGTPMRSVLREVAKTNRYDLEDFFVIGKLDSKTKHKIRTGDRRGYKSRSERDWVIIEALLACGASDRLCEIIFKTQPCGDKYRDSKTNPTYLAHTIEQVRSKSVQFKIAKRQLGEIREGEDGYYAERARGSVRLSTFVFRPSLLLEGDEDAIVGEVAASGYIWANVTLPRSAFNDRKALDKHLKTSAWVWLGRDDDVRALLPYLLRQLQERGLPRSRSTVTLGRHEDLFVLRGQTLSADTLWEGSSGPLVYLETGREAPSVRAKSVPIPDLGRLSGVNLPEVFWPVLGWFMSTPYKTLFEHRNVRFPILNIYGTRGSGKTSLLRLMQRLLGYERPTSYDCDTTAFVALALLGSSNAVPVSFSEFRASSHGAERFLRFVLLAFDVGHNARGRADQTTVDYPLSAPFTIDGEDIINDSAAKERIVAVPLHPETIAEGTDCYAAFREIESRSLEGFCAPYLQYTLCTDFDALLAKARGDISEQFPQALPDRIRNNLTVVTAGILSFCAFTNTDVPRLSCLDAALKSVWSAGLGRSPTLADEFCEFVVNNVAQNSARFFFRNEGKVLWFQLATAFDYWRKQRRFGGLQSLERDAIRAQLLERRADPSTKGQYVIPPKIVDSVWCYGIDLGLAFDSGLDIPGEVNSNTIRVNF